MKNKILAASLATALTACNGFSPAFAVEVDREELVQHCLKHYEGGSYDYHRPGHIAYCRCHASGLASSASSLDERQYGSLLWSTFMYMKAHNPAYFRSEFRKQGMEQERNCEAVQGKIDPMLNVGMAVVDAQ